MKSMRAARSAWPLPIGSGEVEEPRLPGGILVGIGSLAIITAGLVGSAIPQDEAVVRYGVLAATILVIAAAYRRWGVTLVVAGIGFLVFDGFLVDQLGELSWHGCADAARVVTLGAAVIFGRFVGDLYEAAGPARQAADRAPRRPNFESISDCQCDDGEPMAFSKYFKEETHDA